MTISWYGEACFLLESGGVRVLIEPPSKESGINPPRLKSDVLVYSKSQGESASWRITETSAETFVIDGPGEYEIKGINIVGIGVPSNSSGQANTLYNIEMDGIKISHFGFISSNPNDEVVALLGDPNVVLVPVGGNSVLDAEAAMKLINKIEPSVAIPMLYDVKELKIKRAPLSFFLKESGAKESLQPKLTIKKKDTMEEETKIVILEKT